MILFLSCFTLILCSSAAFAEKLSSAKLLLPYHPTIPVSYTLEVTETDPSTCYRWYSSKPGVVSVDPIDPWTSDNTVCSQKALVVSKSQTVTRNTAVIFAENVQTRQVLKCHVVVEKVKSIMIDSKSRELYLEDSPEPFKVLALDEEGNIFSTLSSLPVEWLLLADASSEAALASSTVPSQILRLVRYADTPYEAPDEISMLENSGARGYMVLLEGLQTGIAFISAKIKDPVYRDVSETHVKLRVVANLQLLPGEVYLMPHAVATIRAFMFRQNRPHPLQLPSSQYSAFVGDAGIASFDEKQAIVKAINLGATNVTLIDKNIQIKDDYVPPYSFVYVEKPASIRMSVVQYPHASSPWILEAGRDYEFHIDILDRLGHVLVLPESFVISCLLPAKFFEVRKNTENGTIWHVTTKPDQIGEGVIPVSANWSFKSFKVPLEHSQDFVVYSPIAVHPKIFGLPLALGPDAFVGFALRVTGGSGQYIFMSSDNKIATVDSNGVVRSVTVEPGSAEIKIIDQRNNKHSAVSVAVVGDIAELEFSPESRVEDLVGSRLLIGIRANIIRGREKIPVANCSALKFAFDLTRMPLQDSTETVDEKSDVFKLIGLSFPSEHPTTKGLDCATVALDALRPGFSELKVKSPLPASTVISAYSSLRLDVATEYGASQVVTAVGTKVRLPVLGGPLVWPSERESHVVTVENNPPEKKSDFKHTFSWNSKVVEIFAECHRYGDFELLVTVGNVHSSSSANAVYEKLSITVSCPEPYSIQLGIPWGQDSDKVQPPCPASLDKTIPFPVVVSDTFPVAVSVFDAKHRRFMNVSSFEMKWSFERSFIACSAAQNADHDNKKPCGDVAFDRKIRNSLVNLKAKTIGEENVFVELLGYHSGITNDEKLKFSAKNGISTSLALRVVNPARLTDTDVVLFTIPAATRKIQVLDGSGYFQFNIQERLFVNEHVASTIQSDFKTLSVNPHGKGAFVVEAVDLCLRPGSQRSLTAEVKVLGIDKLRVIGRRFLAIGETVNIGVVAIDASGQHHLPADLYGSISLKPVFAEDKISVTQTEFINDIAIFSITGKTQGLTKLVFTAIGGGTKLLASPEDFSIEVCLPVGISPSPRLVIMDGATYQLAIVGGPISISPKPSVLFRYIGSHSDAITLDKNSGLVHGLKTGDARIEAVLYDTDPLAAKIGKNSAVEIVTPPLQVEVRHLTGIHLASPSTQLESSSLMPVTVFGQYDSQRMSFDYNPSGFGTASPPLSFSWSVSPAGPKIDLLSPMFGPFYSRPLEEDFTVYFRSATPGDFVITVHVARPLQSTFKNLTATLSVSVVLPFRIGAVLPPFTVTVGSELHLPVSGTCSSSTGQPKYSLLSPAQACRNGTVVQSSSVSLGPSNSFVGTSPGQSTFVARCSSAEFLSFSFDVKPHFSYVVVEFAKNDQSSTFSPAAGSKMSGLPYGAAITLNVDYYTQSGRRFDAVSGQLQCRLNRRDAATFYLPSGIPDSITVDLSLADSVSVVACESEPAFPLFLPLVIKPAITPFSLAVNVGDLLCFRHTLESSGVDQQPLPSEWASSDSNNLFIDSKSGVAIALRSSLRETVSVDFGKKFRASASVTVRAISRIDFVSPQPSVISDSTSNNTIVFDLLVEDGLHRRPQMAGSCPVNVNLPASFPLPVVCELSAPEAIHRLFSVSTYFDTTSAPPTVRYNCQVRYLGANQKALAEMGIASYEDFATMEFPLRLYASLASQAEFGERQFTELHFVPSAHLSTTTLQLNAQTLSANLTIAATERVFKSLVVTASHSSFVSVTGPTPVSGQPGKYIYEVTLAAHRKVPANLIDKLNLVVRVPMLNQEHTVSISLPASTTASFSRESGSAVMDDNLFHRFFGSTSPAVVVAYIVVAIVLLVLTLHFTFRGGFFGQPNFVHTVYNYDSPGPSPLRANLTPPLRYSPTLAGADLDSQLLTAFRASSRTPIRPSAGGASLSPGGSGSHSTNRLWSTGYVPEGNLNASFGDANHR